MASDQRILGIVVGTNHAGKTHFVNKTFVQPALRKNRRVLIVVSDDGDEWANAKEITDNFDNPEKIRKQIQTFTGLAKINGTPEILEFLLDFRDGVIVLEDASTFLADKMERDIRILVQRRGQRHFDLIVVAHGLTLVPPRFFPYHSFIIMFRTLDNLIQRRQVLRNYKEYEIIQTSVNKRFKEAQLLNLPKEDKRLYPFEIIKPC